KNRARPRFGKVGIHDVILDDHQAARFERAKALAEELSVGRFIFVMNYIRHEQGSAWARDLIIQVIDADEIDSRQRRGLALGEDSAGNFESGRQIVNRSAETGPSAE